jgi:hypothetical protein
LIEEGKLTGFATSGIVNISVESSASINFSVDTINWGSGRVTEGTDNATLNTGDASNPVINGNWTSVTQGFQIDNIGNQNVSLSLTPGLTAATFIGGSVQGGPYYEFNVSNVDAGSCLFNITEGSSYTANSSGATLICDILNAGAANSVRLDLKLVIPSDSITGDLNDTWVATIVAV